jgi:hypothetical protein
MGETVIGQCPWCGEALEVFVEPTESSLGEGEVLQDCDVCCRPCVVTITIEGGAAQVVIERE